MRYRYRYVTHSTFVPAVEWHFFKLRAIPCDNEFQHVVSSSLCIAPACPLCHSRDGQGNAVQWGAIGEGHEAFQVVTEGEVEQTQPYVLHEVPAGYYRVQTRLTTISREKVKDPEPLPPFALATGLMHLVHHRIAYTPGHTTTRTTAAEVWDDGRGVCQDFAHVMLALCRHFGLPARYACGFIEGEGQTHAWVEVSDGQQWRGFDPTHDRTIEWGYVKLAHGRDADDCPVNRGRFYGCTRETMTVTAMLSPLESSTPRILEVSNPRILVNRQIINRKYPDASKRYNPGNAHR